MEIKASELLGYLGSLIGLITVTQTMLHSFLPTPLMSFLTSLLCRIRDSLSRYHYVEIPEYDDSCLPNELYAAIKLHLSASITTYTRTAKHVKLFRASSSSDFTWSPSNKELVPVTFEGVKLWWEHYTAHEQQHHHSSLWTRSSMPDEKRTYILKLHKKDKAKLLGSYMDHILKQARDIRHQNRERLLYTNGRNDSYRHPWDSVPFKHPSTFDTLALDPAKKRKIKEDLQAFARGEEFYKKTGRAWKRGYLLYGPPGTGKSSLIAAMANLLRYDVYDLELTQVRSNGELRKLLLRTTNKSIIVIEDIDCSLELGSRGKRASRKADQHKGGEGFGGENKGGCMDHDSLMQGSSGGSIMTLSGLLNFTDGLWSCCGDERIFVFTTNHIESLDPALLRSGRMDMHILMSYCTFAAFKILALNYLGIEDHSLFHTVEEAINNAQITPAEVSEILIRNKEKAQTALEELLGEIDVAKSANNKPCPPTLVKEDVDNLAKPCPPTFVKEDADNLAKPWPPTLVKEEFSPTYVLQSVNEDVEQVKRAVQDNDLVGNLGGSQLQHKRKSIKCPNCKTALIAVEEEDPCVDKEMPYQIAAQKKLLQKAD